MSDFSKTKQKNSALSRAVPTANAAFHSAPAPDPVPIETTSRLLRKPFARRRERAVVSVGYRAGVAPRREGGPLGRGLEEAICPILCHLASPP